MITLRAIMLAVVAFAPAACTSSNFGGSGSSKGAALDSSASSKGQDASDGDALGTTDSAADAADSGANDLGGSDMNVPGADSSDSMDAGGEGASGGSDGEGDDGEKDTDDVDDPDSDKSKDKNKDKDKDSDDAGDDDETLAKTKYGAQVKWLMQDDSFDLKMEVLVNGKVLNTANLSFDEKEDDEGVTKVAAAVCRASKDTCLRLTFTNTTDVANHLGHVETAGVTPCVFVKESGTSATVDVDTNGGEGGGMHNGTCREGEDDRLEISCPNSTKLQVQNCGK